MNNGHCSSRGRAQQSVTRRFGMTVSACALALCAGLSASPVRARADSPIAPAMPVQDRPGSVTHGHVFLYGSAAPVDVTSQVVTMGAQTYYVSSDGSWPLYLDYSRGTVFDGASYVVGYIDLS